jgi:alpha-tubulin suppressor-like RCC1 family protein
VKTKSRWPVLAAVVIIFFSVFLSHFSEAATFDDNNNAFGQERVLKTYEKLPLYFIENKGQVDQKVRYYARTAGQTLYFTDEGIVFDLFRKKKSRENTTLKSTENRKHEFDKPNETQRLVISLTFDNQKHRIAPEGIDRQKAGINCYPGNDKTNWKSGVPTFKGTIYKEVCKGIDLKLYGKGTDLEYEFIVHPGADPGDIVLTYQGIEGLTTNKQGDLLIQTPFGELMETKPYIYQEVDGKREITGSFVIMMPSKQSPHGYSYGFQVASYDTSLPLVIDPTLDYSTYIGGNAYDKGYGIAVDNLGNAYITGQTSSADFPVEIPYQGVSGLNGDAFVTKIDVSGNVLSYSTYLGGSVGDIGYAIAVDESGNAYVTGYTCSIADFPLLNPFQPTYGGAFNDAFITKFDNTGALIYSTYLGGAGRDEGYGIAVDNSGNAYVTGYTYSTDFPVENPYQESYTASYDAFVTKLDPSGSALLYSTYLGGNEDDVARDISVDASGNAYVTGYTQSTDFPAKNSYQGTNAGYMDVFITKLSSSGDTLAYSTFLGGSLTEYGYGIAVDTAGNAHVTGWTFSSGDFPTTQNSYQKTFAGGDHDAFIAKIDASGNALLYSTYLGGNDNDFGYGIAVNVAGNAYITGYTSSDNFPLHNPYQQTFGGVTDIFVTKLDASGSALLYSTCLGGNDYDEGYDIASDSSGSAYITGGTRSSEDFPIQNACYDTHLGGYDAFVVKLEDGTSPTSPQPVYRTIAAGGTHTLAIYNDGSLWAWGSNWSGQLGDGTTTEHHSPVQIGTDTNWAHIAAGGDYSIALKNDGSLWTWGGNAYGQLGDGTVTEHHFPVQIGTDTDWVWVAAGGSHIVALKHDGSLWAWGNNNCGQLGNGTTTESHSPTQIGTDTDWAIIEAGLLFTLALKTDGSLWAWGDNNHGQLGDGTKIECHSPKQIGPDTDWARISGGGWHSIALKSDGSLWAWGDNNDGELGYGTVGIDQDSPGQVGTDTDWDQISAGLVHTIAVKANGSLWAWGDNSYGQIGDGTTTDGSFPAQIGTDTNWIEIDGGNNHTVARKSDSSLIVMNTNQQQIFSESESTSDPESYGSLWAWGDNHNGQIGNGTTIDQYSPVNIQLGFTYLYYPHIASTGVWETEICVINRSDSDTVMGTFKAYNNTGELVSDMNDIALSPHGRKEITVGDDFTDPAGIGYIIFESDSDKIAGYTKFFTKGRYRVAIPAASEINTGDIYITHIASDSAAGWGTGISLLNTTSSAKSLTIEFDNGQTKTVDIAANEHKVFLIRNLFEGEYQPDIYSAVIRDAGGVVGLELFTNIPGNQMSGILLKDDTTMRLYYPHTASTSGWATGIVAYNPSDTDCSISITPFTKTGYQLTPVTNTIGGKQKYVGLVSALGLPAETAWVMIDAASPVTGFELFASPNLLAGYTGVGIIRKEGIFVKLEKDGGTGIAFVNIGGQPASVTLNAYDDSGSVVATQTIYLNAYEKNIGTPETIFEEDVSNATYITYISDKQIAGFQLNASSDGMMLDALPGM